MYLSFARVVDIENDELRVSVLFACSSVRCSGNDELRVCLVFLLFRSVPDVFFSVMSRSRWRPSGWKRHSRHHQVAERRGCAGALRLDHLGFGSRCQLCSKDTHWLHFGAFFDTLHEYEAIATLSQIPGQAALRGVSGCSPRKALPGPKSSAPSTSSSSCRSVPLRIYHRRSGCHVQAGKTHDSCISSSLFSVNASGRALGCCGGQPRCVPFLVEGHCGELARHKPRSCFFVRFCWRFLLLLISLLCCLYCVVFR